MKRLDIVIKNAIDAAVEKDSKELENIAIQSDQLNGAGENVTNQMISPSPSTTTTTTAAPTCSAQFYNTWKMLKTTDERFHYLTVGFCCIIFFFIFIKHFF